MLTWLANPLARGNLFGDASQKKHIEKASDLLVLIGAREGQEAYQWDPNSGSCENTESVAHGPTRLGS